MNTNKTIKKDSTIPTPNRAQRKEDLAILKVRNLVISFGSGRKKVKAVKGATFDVYKGETFGLVGESGSGKTTIGRAVMGIQPVSDGTVYFENKVAFGIAPNPYKLNLEVEHNLKMIKLNQNTATLHIETQIQEFKRLFYKYVEGKYYDLKTKEVKDYTDGKNRIISEGKNLKATKLGNSRKILDLVFIKESVRDNLKRLLKVILIQEQLIKFLDGLSNLIDVDPELNIAIVKYQKRTHKLVLKIKELENEIYLSLERIEKYRSEIKKGVYTSANDFFSNLGQELENIVQKHKQLSVMVATAKKWHHTNIDLTETKFNKRRKRIQKINERIVRNEQRNNLETVKELNEVLKLMELPDIQTAIYNSDRFANPTKKYHHELKKKMQMIFQDPASSLNDRMAVEGIIAEGLENFPELYKNDEAVETYIKWYDEVYPEKAGSVTLKNVNYKNVKKFLIIQLLTTVGMLPEHLSRYPHEFSGGQRQRIGIARALVMKPSFIVADEPISALDVSIRAQVMNLLAQFQREFDLTYVFIAHDLSVVRFVANRIAVIYRGDIVELAEADELFNNPMHPYTKSLLSAVPLPDPKQERMKVHYKYDPEVEHPDYLLDFPKWQEITKGHFVYANDRENKQLIEKYVVAKNKAKK